MKYLVIGSGRMAAGIVHDLIHFGNAERIICCDNSEHPLRDLEVRFKEHLNLIKYQISGAHEKEKLIPILKEVDGVISAVPYEFNLNLTKWAIENSCHFVDLGGNNSVVEKQFQLHHAAVKAKVGIIPDCGLAPGMASVIVSHAISKLDETESVKIRVGGLPINPVGPLKYMLVFSVHGLINEYIEPAIILRDGEPKQVDSMTDLEIIKFPEPFGEVEAFYTSGGTSTLPQSYRGIITNLDYKTIRYPGHCGTFKTMIDLGFASEDPIEINGKIVSKRTLFEELLLDPLTYKSEDVVLIRVTAYGKKNKQALKLEYQAIEYPDAENNLTAMMRTTAFPAALALEMLVDGRISESGVLRQEKAIPAELYLRELVKRNIRFEVRESPHNI